MYHYRFFFSFVYFKKEEEEEEEKKPKLYLSFVKAWESQYQPSEVEKYW